MERVFDKNYDIRWKDEIDGIVLYDPETRTTSQLNSVGSEIWQAIDGTLNVEQIKKHISKTFNVSEEQIENDVEVFIELLLSKKIIEVC